MTSNRATLPRVSTPKYGTPLPIPDPLHRPHSPSIISSQGRLSRSRRNSAAPLVSSPAIFTQDQIDMVRSANSSRAPSPHASPLSSPVTRPTLLSDQFTHIGSKPRRRRRSKADSEPGEEEDEETEDEESDIEDESEDYYTKDKYVTNSQMKNTTQPLNGTGSSNEREIRISGFMYPPPPSSITQTIHLEEDDIIIYITGYIISKMWKMIWQLGCVLSVGLLYLLGRWFPKLYIRVVGTPVHIGDADCVVITNSWNQVDIIPMQKVYYNGSIGSIFSSEQISREMATLSFQSMPGGNEYLNPAQIMQWFIWFDYRYIRFGYHPGMKKVLLCGYWKDQNWTNVKRLQQGITRETYLERVAVFGHNEIDVQEKSISKLLVDEILHPFYIFQVFSIILWSLDDYYYYAFCIFFISVTSVTSTLLETRATMKKMREMSRFVCDVKVFRGGFWRLVESTDLVPGDVFDIRSLTIPGALNTVPCDAILLTGDAILNEAMLTGESVPVPKIPITDALLKNTDLSSPTIQAGMQKHFLFSGTRLIRVRAPQLDETAVRVNNDGYSEPEKPVLAITLRTSFRTSKGSLIRGMLFPKPSTFKFYRDSFRFIGVLFLIAFIGFLLSSVNFINMGVPLSMIIVRALDLITIVVPPALPATVSIGTGFAISRLKRIGIFCIAPMRVNVGGKIDCMCFDKTGTLTVEGLDVLGVRVVDPVEHTFSDEIRDVTQLARAELLEAVGDQAGRESGLLYAMATCHALKMVNGKLIGDPLDLKMFEFAGWELEEGGGGKNEPIGSNATKKIGGIFTFVRPIGGRTFELEDMINTVEHNTTTRPLPLEFGIMRCFEFAPSLRRMSVIVRRLTSSSLEVYCKGAPEVMTEICAPETLPNDYDLRLHWYTHRGYRVIACATKSLGKLSYIKAQKIKREQIENDLQFVGFIIFENKLKPATAKIVTKLHEAGIRQVMCTGDNLLTAISVSRECGLVNQTSEIYRPVFISGNSSEPNSKIVWESVINEGLKLDHSLQPIPQNSSHISEFSVQSGTAQYPVSYSPRQFELAVSGEAFRWLIDFSSPEILNRIFVKAQIFARMSPDEKQELMERFQALDYCVGFCGDGANDCGALKAADVGISLSEAEASVAAPFTSQAMDIGCVEDVIKEGRAALVTSFSCFKYMALYSIIQFTTVSLLYSFGSNLGDLQFLYIDLFLILPIAVFMAYSEPYPILARKRPTANLVSKKVLTSLIGQITIQSSFQIFLYWIVRRQEWYHAPDYDPSEKNIISYENTALFQLSCFQYILIAVVFSVGPPYRKPMWANVGYIVSSFLLTLLTIVIVLFPSDWLNSIFELEPTPFSFRIFIVVLAVIDLCISLLCEKYVFPVLAKWFWPLLDGLRRSGFKGDYEALAGNSRGEKKHSKLYKQIKADFND